MTSATALVDRTLALLADSGARTYARTFVLTCLNEQLHFLADILGQNPECGHFKWDEVVTVPAGETEIDLMEELTYTPAEIRSLFHVVSEGHEEPMSPMPAGAGGAYAVRNPVAAAETPSYFERRPPPDAETGAVSWLLVVRPPATGDRDLHVFYRFVAAEMVEAVDNEDPTPDVVGVPCPFSPRWDELMAKGAARRALASRGLNEAVYDADIRDLTVAFLASESRTIGGDIPQGTKEVVGDYLFGNL